MATAAELAPFTTAAAAIEARLRAFFPPSQFTFAFVPEEAPAEVWAELTQRTPFLGLSWRGLAPDANAGRRMTGDCQWSLTLITRHASIAARYLGDATSPALLTMVWIATIALHAHALKSAGGEALGTVMVAGAGNAMAANWGKGQVAIATLQFSTPMPQPGDAYAGVTPELLEMGVTWDFPETAAVTDIYERAP